MSIRSLHLHSLSRSAVVLFTGLALVLNGCSGDDPQPPPAQSSNHAPKASAASSATEVKVGTAITLDAGASTDEDHDTLAFAWTFTTRPDGSKAALADASTAKATFTPDVVGTYVAAVAVDDGKGGKSSATLEIKAVAGNAKPTAVASASSTDVASGTAITLDGSKSSDPDGDAITYAWAIASAPKDSAAKLSSATDAKPTITLDKEGEYAFTLVVKDAQGAESDPAKVTVKVHAKGVNGAPTAVAEASATEVKVGQDVALDGTKSSDPDGDTFTFAWTLKSLPATSAAKLSDPKASKPKFTADVAGVYVAELVVTDAKGAASPAASVTITAKAENGAPTAVAQASSAEAPIGTPVTLDGSKSTDPDKDPLTYAWQLKSAPTGSKVAIAAADATKASFAFTPDVKGSYTFALVVKDDHAHESAPASVTVTAKEKENSAPTARPKAPAEAEIGTTVSLDGSDSSDPDKDPITFAWTLVSAPAGSASALADATAAKASIVPDKVGHYVIALVVKDDKGKASEAARVDVEAVVADAAPTAVAKASATSVETGAVVTLDGSGSNDAENEPLTYGWSIVSAPKDSKAALSSTDAPKPTFTADKAGTYVVALTVKDRKKSSAEARVTITATEFNAPPTAKITASATQIRLGAELTFDGSGSTDPEKAALTYAWALRGAPAGSAAKLASTTDAKVTLKPDVKGFYVVELVVNDGTKSSAPVSATVEVKEVDAAPNAVLALSANAVSLGQKVTLDASKSTDPENEPLTYAWLVQSRPDGSTAALGTSTDARTTFTPDKLGQYVFTLVVKDNAGNASETQRATLTVVADNAAPTADAKASAPQVELGGVVTLDGSASRDPENAPLRYGWLVRSRPAGSTAALSDASAVKPTFSPDKIGFYVFELVVNDGEKASEATTVTVEATRENLPPVAKASASSNEIAQGGVITLDGSASSDPENGPITFAWSIVSKPAGSTATLSDAKAVKPTAKLDVVGFYVFQLVVSDGAKTTTSDPVTVHAVTANAAPTAVAKASATQVAVGADVTLDGSASHDPENTPVTYEWHFISQPLGSKAALSSASAAKPTFTADVAGDYVVELIVHDDASPSQPVTLTVTAK